LLTDRILHQDSTSLQGWSMLCNLLFVACTGRLSKTIALQTGEILLNGHSRKNKTMCYGTAAVGSKLEYCTSQVLMSSSLSLSLSGFVQRFLDWLMIDRNEFLLVECGTGSLGRNVAKLLPVFYNSLAVSCIINFSLFLELKLHNFRTREGINEL
jgi:hypothetical protein